MHLDRETHDQLERFFREYFGDPLIRLPRMRFYGNRLAELLNRRLDIWGITIGRFIFIRPDLFIRDPQKRLCLSRNLLAHEATHAVQFQKLGLLRFFYIYLRDYWKALKNKEKWDARARNEAYLEIPLEAEARECAAAFVEWTRKPKGDSSETFESGLPAEAPTPRL